MTSFETANMRAPHAEHASHTSLNVFHEFAVALYDGAIGNPLASMKQIAGVEAKDVLVKNPKAALHGSMRVAEVLGETTGQLIDLAIAGKVCEGALGKLSEKVGAELIPTNEGKILYDDRFPTKYSVYENRVELSYKYRGTDYKGTFLNLPTRSQYRVDASRGIVVHDGKAEIFHMPAHVNGADKLTYTLRGTVLQNEHGTFSRNLTSGSIVHQGAVSDGGWEWKYGNGEVYTVEQNGDYKIHRSDNYDTYFDKDGRATRAIDSSGQSLLWTFGKDGSFRMDQEKLGRDSLEVNPDGTGIYRQRSGSGASLKEKVTPVKYDPETNRIAHFAVPDRTPMPKIVERNISRARSILEQLAVTKPNAKRFQLLPTRSLDPNHTLTVRERRNFEKAYAEGSIQFFQSSDWDYR